MYGRVKVLLPPAEGVAAPSGWLRPPVGVVTMSRWVLEGEAASRGHGGSGGDGLRGGGEGLVNTGLVYVVIVWT